MGKLDITGLFADPESAKAVKAGATLQRPTGYNAQMKDIKRILNL